jgi:hypothetical protein
VSFHRWRVNLPSVAGQLTAHGKDWRAYLQNLPESGTSLANWPRDNNTAKLYAVKHNPFPYVAEIQDDPATPRMGRLMPRTLVRSNANRRASRGADIPVLGYQLRCQRARERRSNYQHCQIRCRRLFRPRASVRFVARRWRGGRHWVHSVQPLASGRTSRPPGPCWSCSPRVVVAAAAHHPRRRLPAQPNH